VSALAPLGLLAVAIEGASLAVVVSDEQSGVLALLAGTVAAVVASVAWIDGRISRQIAVHALQDELRHEAIIAKLETLQR
jgi:hypothetical protein